MNRLHWSSILLDIRERHWNMLRHDVISIFRHFGSQFIQKTNAANPNSLHTAVGNGSCGSADQSTVFRQKQRGKCFCLNKENKISYNCNQSPVYGNSRPVNLHPLFLKMGHPAFCKKQAKKTGSFFIQKEKRPGCHFSF